MDQRVQFDFEIEFTNGRVYAYDGRNYLVPLMFQVYPAGDLSRRQ